MKEFATVIYDFHASKKLAMVIRSDWILPTNNGDGYCARKWIFYHSDPEQDPPSYDVLYGSVSDCSKLPQDGFVYGGLLLGTFGKSRTLILMCNKLMTYEPF
jgi:hypothetical protein